MLLNPSWFNLIPPISHLVTRDLDVNTYSDDYLEVTGAKVPTIKLWWYIEWPSTIKSLTLKKTRVNRRCPHTNNKLISINLLECVADIITYDTVAISFSFDSSIFLHPYPLLFIWTDDMSAKTWLKRLSPRKTKENLFNASCVISW